MLFTFVCNSVTFVLKAAVELANLRLYIKLIKLQLYTLDSYRDCKRHL